jgi:hypothetical protein
MARGPQHTLSFLISPDRRSQAIERVCARCESDTDLLLLRTAVSGQFWWAKLRQRLVQADVKLLRAPEVRHYLEQHPDLACVLGSLCQSARNEFGTEAGLLLKVYHDPEIEDEYLVLRVRPRKYSKNVLCLIRAVSDRYEAELADGTGTILVTTDFRPIR